MSGLSSEIAAGAIRACISNARAAAAKRDWEAAHAEEDSAFKMLAIAVARGLNVRAAAADLVACRDEERPRPCG